MAGFLGLDELFEGRHFDRDVIVLCVRWYLRFKLSFRDLDRKAGHRLLGGLRFAFPDISPQLWGELSARTVRISMTIRMRVTRPATKSPVLPGVAAHRPRPAR